MRFTIRDLLWLTVVVALGAALWIQTRRYEEAAQEAKNRTIESDYWVQQVIRNDQKLDAERGKRDAPNLSPPAQDSPSH